VINLRKIFILRKKAGLKQKEVANAVGIAISTYSSIETGKRKPSVKAAKRLGNYLGFDWQIFFEEDENETTKKNRPNIVTNVEAETGTQIKFKDFS
jgi:transcriptional regulator with XRE-family HTH domain